MDPQLKQRLIGVTVIVALIVIFVPMFFEDSETRPIKTLAGIPPIPDEVRETTLELPKAVSDVAPPSDEKKPETGRSSTSSSGYTVIPLSDPEPPQKETPAATTRKVSPAPPVEISDEEDMGADSYNPSVPAAAPSQAVAPSQTVAPAPAGKQKKPAVELPTTQPKGQTKPKVSVPAVPVGKVATMNDEQAVSSANGGAAVQNATATPDVSNTKTLTQQGKPSTTVKPVAKPKQSEEPATQTIPPATKPAAAKTAAQPHPVVDATVSSIPQSSAKPTGSKPGAVSAWVVQTGSFTTETNAKSLVERLRQSKFAAFVEAVQGESGAVYRVQVGPELDRAHAEQLQKQIEGSVGIKGIILPHR